MVAFISVIVSVVAVAVAIWSAVESRRANTRAGAANQLAKQANTLAKESNDHAAEANEISSQALELAKRNAPAPLSELIKIDKNDWAFKNNSGREIKLLSISVLPDEAERFIRVKPLPKILENGDQFTLTVTGVWGLKAETLVIEWCFVSDDDEPVQRTHRNLY